MTLEESIINLNIKLNIFLNHQDIEIKKLYEIIKIIEIEQEEIKTILLYLKSRINI